MRDKIKILVVEPMKPCEVREIPDTLEAMQALVGGYIQAVYPFQEEVAVIQLYPQLFVAKLYARNTAVTISQ